MGKVGSTAVYQGLRDLQLPVAVEHVHLLTNFDSIEQNIRRMYAAPSTTLDELNKGRRLRLEMDSRTDIRWNVITLVREPVHRNISAFFESLDEIVPEARQGNTTIEELGHAFLERFNHDAPMSWIKTQLTPVFGLDPYAVPFPHQAGFQILEGDRARLLIIRMEDVTRCISKATGSFLGRNIRHLPRANTTESKWYGQLHDRFLAEFELPAEYFTRLHGSQFARHFYTPEELALSSASVRKA